MRHTIDIHCDDFCVIGHEIWFSNAEMNGLYKKRFDKEESEFISFFPNEELWRGKLHGNVIHYENKLVFTPSGTDNISVYDLVEGTFLSYNIDWTKIGLDAKAEFYWAVLYGTYVYMFGYYQPCILKFDIESGKYDRVDGWFEQYRQFGYYKERELFSARGVRVEESLYLFTKQNNVLIEFDLRNEQFQYYTIGDGKDRFIAAEYSNSNFWLLSRQGELLEWNKTEGVIKRIPVNLDSDYYRSVRHKEYVIFLPSGNGRLAFGVNSTSGEIEWENVLDASAWVAKEIGGDILFYSNQNNNVYRLNGDGWDDSGHLFIDYSIYNSIIWKEIKGIGKGFVHEDGHWKLENHLAVVLAEELLNGKDIQESRQVGSLIFEKGL